MATNKKVLYLSYDGLTDPLGQSQILPYILELSKRGFHYDIISFEKPERYMEYASTIREMIKGCHITWHPLRYTKRPPILSTINDIRSMQRTGSTLIRKNSHDIIHSRSYIASMVALKLSSRHSVPFIFDMRGFWADERVEGNIWDLKNPVYRMIYNYFKRLELTLLKRSSAVISLTHRGKEEILTWNLHENMDKKIHVIPCCTDVRHFDPELKSGLGDKAKHYSEILKGRKMSPVIAYLGAIGTWYMLVEMLGFFKEVLNEFPDAALLFITPENESTIRSACSKLKIPQDNIIITEGTRKEVPELLSLADTGLFFIRPTFSKTASSPTKQAEFMAMGIPVICNSGVGDTDMIVNRYRSGLVLQSMDSREFRKGVQFLKQNTFIEKTSIRDGAIDYFSLSKGVDEYQKVYNGVLNGDTAHSSGS